MKLKYYLRGLGIGIIVTAVIMGIVSGKKTLSDREIKERAAALGMVEGTEPGNSLADLAAVAVQDPTETPEETPTPEPESTAEPTQAPTQEPEPSAEPTKAPTPIPESSAEPTKAPTPEPESSAEPAVTPAELSKEDVTIVVKSGESSYTICKKLEQAGLITSASDFDTYLYLNGYDRKLRAGSFVIPADASQESIADILTSGQ